MRSQTTRQDYLDFGRKSTVKIVREWQRKYQAIDELLLKNPKIVDLVHEDFEIYLSASTSGRKSKFTTEEMLRALIVMFLEGEDYRGAVIRIDESEFLRGFVGLGPCKKVMDYTFLCKAMCALRPETAKAINEALTQFAVDEEIISGEKLCGDTTVYETNIHYPTDSTLLWDLYRVLARELKEIQKELTDLEVRHRFHCKKAKKRMLYISRYAKSKAKHRKREVKRTYRELVSQVRWITNVSAEMRQHLQPNGFLDRMLIAYEELADRVMSQTEKRVFEGITVPAAEKIYSIFEPHTELIKRGKAGKDVEFGHKILVAQTGQRFITQYEVYQQVRPDAALVDEILQEHRSMFDDDPDAFSLDQGFYENAQKLKDLRKAIPTVSIRKKGKKSKEEAAIEGHEDFKAGQRFRAGIESAISILKRGYKLNRCLFKGFKNYAVSVGLAVLCHNLVLLTRL